MKIHSHVNSFTVFFYSSGNMVQSKLLLMNIEYFNQCVSSRRSCSVQLLQHYWSGIDLDYCDIEWFALETKRDHSVIFEMESNSSVIESCLIEVFFFLKEGGLHRYASLSP